MPDNDEHDQHFDDIKHLDDVHFVHDQRGLGLRAVSRDPIVSMWIHKRSERRLLELLRVSSDPLQHESEESQAR
jgi:hypothetical protein